MKKTFYFLGLMALLSCSFSSCTDNENLPDKEYDRSLLIGKWHQASLYYRYDNNGSGVSWDTSDDVSEAEGQAFTWTLIRSTLEHIEMIEMGGKIPKIFTVTELTNSILKYQDEHGETYTFSKVQ